MNRPPIISPEPVFFDNRRQSRRPLAGRMAFNNMESDAATGPGGQPPEISIITPCYNAVHHLRDAIESVRRQAGVRVEHIVVDAASQDGTVDVLREYPNVRWISEPDQGQADAFNKGLALARAPLIGWLNADDMYEPGALAAVVRFFCEHPDAFLVNGHLIRVDPAGKQLEYLPAKSSRFWLRHFWFRWYWLNHPSTFYRKAIFDAVGPIDTRLHYAMDYDFYLRASRRFEFYDIDFLTTRMRVHPDAKTSHGWDNFAADDARRSLAKVWKPQAHRTKFYAYSLLGVADVRREEPSCRIVHRTARGPTQRRSPRVWHGPPPGGLPYLAPTGAERFIRTAAASACVCSLGRIRLCADSARGSEGRQTEVGQQ